MALYEQSALLLSECKFHDNTATDGAGVIVDGRCMVHTMESLWMGNEAEVEGCCILCNIGAITPD